MIYLVLSIICSVMIANFLKFISHRKNISFLTMFMGNYFIASIMSFSINETPIMQTDRFDIFMGGIAGVMLISCFLIYRKSIVVSGLAVSVSAMRASLMIPVLISLALFGEKLFFWNYAGIILVIVAFIILGKGEPVHGFLWIIALFASSGIMDSFFKLYKVYGAHSDGLFLFIGFVSSFFVTLLILVFQKKTANIQSFLWGILLGIPNQLTVFFFMKSLNTMPATIAYPMRASSIVLLCVASDILFWKLRINRKQLIGYGIIAMGIVLLNIS